MFATFPMAESSWKHVLKLSPSALGQLMTVMSLAWNEM